MAPSSRWAITTPTNRGEYPGTGIGLALCQKVVTTRDGEIRVDTEPGERTTFSVTLSRVRDVDRGGCRC